jgi:hypothetical protein
MGISFSVALSVSNRALENGYAPHETSCAATGVGAEYKRENFRNLESLDSRWSEMAYPVSSIYLFRGE